MVYKQEALKSQLRAGRLVRAGMLYLTPTVVYFGVFCGWPATETFSDNLSCNECPMMVYGSIHILFICLC